MRRKVSSGPLLWQVVREPSWPVLRAMTMSSASAPRTSPTTSRSGRMRSAARTNERTVTSPTPSTDGGRDSSRTTCGVGEAQLGRVLDGDDALARRDAARECVEQRRLARGGGAADDEVGALADQRDEERDDRSRGEGREGHAAGGEAADGEAGSVDGEGGMTAWTREPSVSRASTIGLRAVDPEAEWRDDPLDQQRRDTGGEVISRARAGPAAPPRPRDRR